MVLSRIPEELDGLAGGAEGALEFAGPLGVDLAVAVALVELDGGSDPRDVVDGGELEGDLLGDLGALPPAWKRLLAPTLPLVGGQKTAALMWLGASASRTRRSTSPPRLWPHMPMREASALVEADALRR